MFVGLCFAIAACLVWGLIFVVPMLLGGFSPVEVVLGRYITYGIFSCLLLFRRGFGPLRVFTPRVWKIALILALCANPVYYVGTIIGIRFASAPLTVLILGLAPIAIVIYGNWRVSEISIRQLLVPFIAIILGLVCVNGAEIDWTFKSHPLSEYGIGFVGILVALILWTLYVVHNARFLKKNPQIPTSDWATVLGVATLVWVVILAALLQKDTSIIDLKKLFTPSKAIVPFWLASAVLGVICSWVGCFLWNRASALLPVSLMGPLMIFETLFGLIYVYILEMHIPPLLEIVGALLMLGGVLLSIQIFRKSGFKSH